MKDELLKGEHYKAYARCSTTQQADTSIDDQIKAIREFATLNEMTEVGHPIIHGGISGSIDRSAEELLAAVDRARDAGEDFAYVVVFDESRFTRQGMDAGAVFEHELGKLGATLISVVGYCPEDGFSGMRKGFNREAARYHAQSIGINVSRGSQTSLEDGRSVGCKTPPFGIDKLILTADGHRLWILRHNADGSQDQIDPETRQVKQTFAANSGRGGTSHYRKAKSERVQLVPADDSRANTVHRIFRLHDGDGKGAHVIAGLLNDEGVRSPRGLNWSACTVLQILNNPVYIGRDIANRRSSAIYARRAPRTPQLLARKRTKIGWGEKQKKRPPTITRPREEWFEQEHAALRGFLPAEIRAIAKARILARLEKEAKGNLPKPNERGGGKRSFLLTNLLRSSQGGHLMIGHPGGTKDNPRRYYKLRASVATPGHENKLLRKHIPAEPIDSFVLTHLQQTLCDLPDLTEHFLEHLNAASQREYSESRAAQLRASIHSLDNKIERLIYAVEQIDNDAFAIQLADLREQRENAKEELRALEDAQPPSKEQLRELAQSVHRLAERLHEMPVEKLRPLIEIFVPRITVDLQTRLVEAEFAIPEWASLASAAVGGPPAPAYRDRRFTNLASISAQRKETLRIPLRCGEEIRRRPRLKGCTWCRRHRRPAA